MTTKRLTTEDLAVIEARANAATAQPWHPAQDEFETMSDMTHATCVSLSRGGLTLHLALAGRTHVEAMRATDEAGEDEDAGNVFAAIVGNGPSSAANAAFIAAARTDVPDLIAEVRALTAERDELRAIVEGRKVAPTLAEIAAHSGEWLCDGETVTLYFSDDHDTQLRVNSASMDGSIGDSAARVWLSTKNAEGALWVAIDEGRPCAWPKVTP